MKVYLITYDLNDSGKNYTELFDAIKAYKDWQHPLESTWFIASGQTANEIYENLRKVIDDNDNLFVVEISTVNHQGWLPKSFWEWLNSRKDV